MATGLNMFSLVEELSSPAFRKIAALVSPKRGYPELPTYPTIPALPIATIKVPTLVYVCVCLYIYIYRERERERANNKTKPAFCVPNFSSEWVAVLLRFYGGLGFKYRTADWLNLLLVYLSPLQIMPLQYL